MTHEIPSADELMRVTFDHDLLERMKLEKGCAVRTLSSVAGVEATGDEYKYRALQTLVSESQRTKPNTKEINDIDELKRLLREAIDAQTADIVSLFEKFQTHDTPLGVALSLMTIFPFFTTAVQYERLMERGRQVALLTPNHIFHLGKVGGRFVSLSDGRIPVPVVVNQYTPYSGFVFRSEIPVTPPQSS